MKLTPKYNFLIGFVQSIYSTYYYLILKLINLTAFDDLEL